LVLFWDIAGRIKRVSHVHRKVIPFSLAASRDASIHNGESRGRSATSGKAARGCLPRSRGATGGRTEVGDTRPIVGLSELRGDAAKIYMRICGMVQRDSKTTVKLTSKQIQELGVGVNYVRMAVDNLDDLGLVAVIRRKGPRGYFEFELLDMLTGFSLPTTYARKLDASKLTDRQLDAYFMHRLRTNYSHHDSQDFMAFCPFHEDGRKKPTLSVKTVGSGAWHCFKPECPHHAGGSIIYFEVAYNLLFNHKPISMPLAWERVACIIRGAQRQEEIDRQSVDNAMAEMSMQ
jgi:hypothetical protein